jgi:alpha-amylase
MFRSGMLLAGALTLGVSLGSAQTGTVALVPATDPSIAYSGRWVPDSLEVQSSGAARVSDQSGARASFSFSGTGITWIGSTAFNRGVARVSLDGTANTVDTYSDLWHTQQVLFVAKGLNPGLHSFSIESTQMRNVNAEGSGISIDAFNIENGSIVSGGVSAYPGYIEQNTPAVTFTGNWYLNNGARASGGSSALAVDPGSRANVRFNGTGIIWIGYMDPWSGWVRVYVDGVLITTLDTYYLPWGNAAVDEIWQRPIWGITDLANGPHTLSIEVLGQKASQSGGSWIWIDAFRVLGTTPSA